MIHAEMNSSTQVIAIFGIWPRDQYTYDIPITPVAF